MNSERLSKSVDFLILKDLNNAENQQNNSEYDFDMTQKETIGALAVVVGAAFIFWGLQLIPNLNTTNIVGIIIQLSLVGLFIIGVGIGMIIYVIKKVIG